MKKTSLFFLLVFSAMINIAGADIYYVNCFTGDDAAEGSLIHPKRTIQSAIDISTHGDTIYVSDGVYTDIGNRSINFSGKAITLRSENGPMSCIIDCQAGPSNPQRAFTFDQGEGADSVVDGFTITGGYGWGAGIYCQNSSPTIQNCIISNNSSGGKGGGIACDNAAPTVVQCVITHNSAIDGGGIYCSQSHPTFRACTVSHNRAIGSGLNGLGGGLYCDNNSSVEFSCSFIDGNRALSGGGIYARDSLLTLINNLVTGNLAYNYGGALYGLHSSSTIINCTLTDNQAGSYGGALRAFDAGLLDVVNSILWGNAVWDNDKGMEVALAKNSAAMISFSNIQGGRNMIHREADCVLSWDQTNVEFWKANGEYDTSKANPLFAQPGYWDDNDTTETADDDFWVPGDYRLLPGSPCMDRGSNTAMTGYERDMAENRRLINGLIDLGAYETGMEITKLLLKAGKNRQMLEYPSDFFSLSGFLDVDVEGFVESPAITVYLGPYSETIFLTGPFFLQVGNKPVYIYKRRYEKGTSGGIHTMKFDLVKGKFSLLANNINLSGLAAPVEAALRIGDEDLRVAVAGERTANGRQPIPMEFMMGQADTLRIDKVKFKPGPAKKGPGHDYLSVEGGISLANLDLDLTGKRIDIHWGTYHDFIPAEGWLPDKKREKFIYKKRAGDETENGVVLALFDFKKCLFKFIVKEADIGPLNPPKKLILSFDGFEATVRPPY